MESIYQCTPYSHCSYEQKLLIHLLMSLLPEDIQDPFPLFHGLHQVGAAIAAPDPLHIYLKML